jgi:RNase P protein component
MNEISQEVARELLAALRDAWQVVVTASHKARDVGEARKLAALRKRIEAAIATAESREP